MKRINRIIALQFVVFFAFSLLAGAQEYVADAPRTILKWEGKGVGKAHQGAISIKQGSLTIKDGVPVSGKFTIDMTSITNMDLGSESSKERLIGHLKSDDFFSVETFPEAHFIVTGSHPGSDGSVHVHGDLTIKGKTHPVEFLAESSFSGNSGTFKGRIEVDRSLYDVRYGSGKFFDNLGDKTINDIFTLDFELSVKKSG